MKRNEYTLYSKKINSDKNIAIVSDIHIKKYTNDNTLNYILDTIDILSPTHIVIPGDLYNGNNVDEEKIVKFINMLTDIAEVFYVSGDSENDKKITFSNKRFNVLDEKNNLVISNELNISGLEFEKLFYKQTELNKLNTLYLKYKEYLEKLSEKMTNNNFNILLCHDPIIKDLVSLMEISNEKPLNFDLLIGGHYHGFKYPEYLKPIISALSNDIKKYYPTHVNGIHECDSNSKIIISEGVNKCSSFILQSIEMMPNGTIENVRILKK